MECLRCNEELKFLKEFKFESEQVDRGVYIFRIIYFN